MQLPSAILSRFPLRGGFFWVLLFGSSSMPAAEPPSAPSAIHAPLRVHPKNPRYFTDDGNRAIYLTGSHTWDNLQDMTVAGSTAPFNFEEYIRSLADYGHNFFRLWRWELTGWDTTPNDAKNAQHFAVAPHPWPRTGPGYALDGKPKFDLSKFDDEYFQRLRYRVAVAGGHGVYTSVMLFEGWGLQHIEGAWKSHPFHPDNNINGIGGDVRDGTDVDTLRVPAITKLQEAYVRKVVETVGDLDNVLYEIANEAGGYSVEWQEHFIRFVHEIEKGRPMQHPVGMTFPYSRDEKRRGSNADLLQSGADWISPNPDAGKFNYKSNPPPADGSKVIVSDTDHLWGIGGDVAWVWKSFTRGENPIFMDPWRQHVLKKGDENQWERVRKAMGATRRVADGTRNFDTMTPQPSLASTGYCLTNIDLDWVVFLPEGGSVTVDLSKVKETLSASWIELGSDGAWPPGDSLTGGTKHTLKAPFKGPAVLVLTGGTF